MIKIAIFAEGQAEQVFIRHLLGHIIGYSDLSFKCHKLYANCLQDVRYEYPNQNAKFHFLIINACGDEKVLSAIIDRIDNLRTAGYEKFIGIRDMYCDTYHKKSPDMIDEALNQQLIDGVNKAIQSMNAPDQVFLYFSIMEIEAWILSMYNLFSRINPKLTLEYIKQELGYNLRDIDPQKVFYKPSDEVDNIFKLIGSKYTKKYSEIESICSEMNTTDFQDAKANGRCKNFAELYSDISNSI
jgi:hypothetical protein